ncbi:tRNA (N6-isopentenyl adenosine(37)-C2)-methylthiotransferase MiaB [Opitutales bacterium]|nr:tRNA (N6-isopentenyl adenosine(37)-C2)-methylthiotransferase MiaB [Opitutales bacterium]
MSRVFIKTYGCQMNERDSEAVACKLLEYGHEITDEEEKADVILLNTCSVREKAEQKAIGKASRLLNRSSTKKKPVVGVIGCMAQNRGMTLLDELPGLGLVVGTQKFHRVPELLERKSSSGPVVELGEEIGSQNEIKHHLHKGDSPTAFVSIMQGCNMNCSFCIVPKTRGIERYRSISEILQEIEELTLVGVKEVTLLGQIVNAYGRGQFERVDGKSPFVQLLEKIHELPKIHRIRFTSPHPIAFGNDLIDAFGRLPKLGQHAHLPMQSGSNRILESMNRPYKIEKFLHIVESLREKVPGMRLSTDVIVGFPGETLEDFELTKKAFVQAGFEMGFIFKYSDRSGTPSVEMDGKVEVDELERRNHELLDLLEKQSLSSNRRMLEQAVEVLVEGEARKGGGQLMGRTRCFRKVNFEGDSSLIGEIRMIEVTRATPYSLFGTLTN